MVIHAWIALAVSKKFLDGVEWQGSDWTTQDTGEANSFG